MQDIGIEAIRAAVDAGRDVVKRTPVVPSVTLSEMLGGNVVLKAENLQRTGAFKIRGAMNKLASLGDAVTRGVTAGSAGNHAQAIAFAAHHRGVPCEIFVPGGASISKVESCRAFGAVVHEVGATISEALAAAKTRAEATGMAFCHPFDDPVVVAGQGTLGLELVDDVDDLACVIVPLGGGGLASGTAIAVKTLRPEVRVIAVQAAACAPFLGAQPADGPVVTLADGIAVKHPGVDHPSARRDLGRRGRRRRRGHDRRRDGAADGARQALRRGCGCGRRGGVDERRGVGRAARARRASCCRAATSTSASCQG